MIDKIESRFKYDISKKSKIGDLVKCPSPDCNNTFKKKTYNKVFCSKKCKDDYWNYQREKEYLEHPYSSDALQQW